MKKIKINSGCDFPMYPKADSPDIKIGVYKDILEITQVKLGVINTINIKLSGVSKLVEAMEKVWARNL